MISASQKFNDLPHDHRMIASAVIIETQINQIRRDQETAKAAHRKFMSETNDHLRNLEKSLAKRLAEIEDACVLASQTTREASTPTDLTGSNLTSEASRVETCRDADTTP